MVVFSMSYTGTGMLYIGVVLEARQQRGVHLVVEVNMLNPSALVQQ
jgi:hypothetical protein